jgi:hypothetical protein
MHLEVGAVIGSYLRTENECQRAFAIATIAVPAPGVVDPLILWSTNTHMKYRIQNVFAGGSHFVWCSPVFEGAALPRYALGASQPASSDPATIYRQLYHAVKTNDGGDAKIASQKKVLRALALQWLEQGAITDDQRDEIVAMVKYSQMADWRPLLYVIPYGPVASRVRAVPRKSRASQEPEYIVEDLVETEFHIIEPMPWN